MVLEWQKVKFVGGHSVVHIGNGCLKVGNGCLYKIHK